MTAGLKLCCGSMCESWKFEDKCVRWVTYGSESTTLENLWIPKSVEEKHRQNVVLPRSRNESPCSFWDSKLDLRQVVCCQFGDNHIDNTGKSLSTSNQSSLHFMLSCNNRIRWSHPPIWTWRSSITPNVNNSRISNERMNLANQQDCFKSKVDFEMIYDAKRPWICPALPRYQLINSHMNFPIFTVIFNPFERVGVCPWMSRIMHRLIVIEDMIHQPPETPTIPVRIWDYIGERNSPPPRPFSMSKRILFDAWL
jgi:hypothetical protein